jgi:hypothetical protein
VTLSRFIREQNTATVAEYRRRVRRLATIYAGIVLVAVSAIVAIVVRGRFFVTLAQRSNVETLTLAVVLLLFAYLAVLSTPGALGALRIVGHNAPAWLGADRSAVERRKQAALRRKTRDLAPAYLNCVVRVAGHRDEPIIIPLADDAGSLGTVVIDGAKLTCEHNLRGGSNSMFAYLANRIQHLARTRDAAAQVSIVQWGSIDDDAALRYGSLVAFACSLQRHLAAGPLWPTVTLPEADVAVLRAEAAALCPTLRDEAWLPDVEFEAEHRLPIIPEPLAFIALSRREQRADPVASMGCAFLVTVGILVLLVFFLWFPPWVPSK